MLNLGRGLRPYKRFKRSTDCISQGSLGKRTNAIYIIIKGDFWDLLT
jgi:hypothetical protein